MENLLQVLKEATLFILTTQLFRHLLPGKKYLPYENVILSMAVLSMLIADPVRRKRRSSGRIRGEGCFAGDGK